MATQKQEQIYIYEKTNFFQKELIQKRNQIQKILFQKYKEKIKKFDDK